MQIKGLIHLTKAYHNLFTLIVHNANDLNDLTLRNPEVAKVHQMLAKSVKHIEGICEENHATPADLPNPSYRAYQWLNFLREEKWLTAHLRALDEFYALIRQLSNVKKLPSTPIEIILVHSHYLYCLKHGRQRIVLEINEGFLQAPENIKCLLVEGALKDKSRKHSQAIRAYAQGNEYEEIMRVLQSTPYNNQRTSYKGRFFDLKTLFTELNLEYFQGELELPRLIWSARRSNRRLGSYDPRSKTITINRRFDSAETPPLLLSYILYHEMLHYAMGLQKKNGRWYAHTSAFKKAEKRFKGHREAEKLVKKLNE